MPELEHQNITTALQQGVLTLKGEFMWGSNYTFLVEVRHAEETYQGVYKPTQGERPLWDFPVASLARREAAAYLVSQALGWQLVPPTVYRPDGPIGPGSLQLFIEHNPEYHYFNFSEEDRQRLRPVALFDVLINNADRKGSHILFDTDHHLWLIDHGICFHVENKLRTVIWDFAGERLSEELVSALNSIRPQLDAFTPLTTNLGGLLGPEEISALAARADRLLARGRYPNPHSDRRPYPWPPV